MERIYSIVEKLNLGETVELINKNYNNQILLIKFNNDIYCGNDIHIKFKFNKNDLDFRVYIKNLVKEFELCYYNSDNDCLVYSYRVASMDKLMDWLQMIDLNNFEVKLT